MWHQIEAAVISKIAAVSAIILRDRIHINIEKKLYNGCFGVVTWHALQLVQRPMKSISLHLGPCTGNFKRSMRLLWARICDIKKTTGGLITSDFHENWRWECDSTLQPFLYLI